MAQDKFTEMEKLQQEKVAEGISKIDAFYNAHKKAIYCCIACLALLAVVVVFKQKHDSDKTAEAQEHVYQAQDLFDKGEFELALEGDGNTLGFRQVIEEYGSAAGEAVYFAAGVCALQTGNFEEAIKYLDQYDGSDTILAAKATAAKADAYSALENYDKAISLYLDAAKADNAYSAGYLFKAATVLEEKGDAQKALELYNQIKEDYPMSVEAQTIDKYITRIEYSK